MALPFLQSNRSWHHSCYPPPDVITRRSLDAGGPNWGDQGAIEERVDSASIVRDNAYTGDRLFGEASARAARDSN